MNNPTYLCPQCRTPMILEGSLWDCPKCDGSFVPGVLIPHPAMRKPTRKVSKRKVRK